MPSILFICTYNRFRSALAECYFRNLIKHDPRGDGWKVSSAGTWAEESKGATTEAVQAAAKRGLKLGGHLSRAVNEEMLRGADLVVTMESGQMEALLQEFPWLLGRVGLLSEVCGLPAYDIPDPYFTDESPEAVAGEIESLLVRNYRAIVRKVEENHL
jgi:protein-tyrosine phosphatase